MKKNTHHFLHLFYDCWSREPEPIRLWPGPDSALARNRFGSGGEPIRLGNRSRKKALKHRFLYWDVPVLQYPKLINQYIYTHTVQCLFNSVYLCVDCEWYGQVYCHGDVVQVKMKKLVHYIKQYKFCLWGTFPSLPKDFHRIHTMYHFEILRLIWLRVFFT